MLHVVVAVGLVLLCLVLASFATMFLIRTKTLQADVLFLQRRFLRHPEDIETLKTNSLVTDLFTGTAVGNFPRQFLSTKKSRNTQIAIQDGDENIEGPVYHPDFIVSVPYENMKRQQQQQQQLASYDEHLNWQKSKKLHKQRQPVVDVQEDFQEVHRKLRVDKRGRVVDNDSDSEDSNDSGFILEEQQSEFDPEIGENSLFGRSSSFSRSSSAAPQPQFINHVAFQSVPKKTKNREKSNNTSSSRSLVQHHHQETRQIKPVVNIPHPKNQTAF